MYAGFGKRLVWLTALILSACEPGTKGEPDPDEDLIAVREANETCIPPTPVLQSGVMAAEKAFPNLPALGSAIAMVQPPADDSLWFVALLDGHIYGFQNNPNSSTLSIDALDISAKVLSGTGNGEFGMTGFAFHPNFPTDNRIFIIYNDNENGITSGGRSVVASFEMDITTHVIDPSSETQLFEVEQPVAFHNGGDIAFGTDGLLYAAFGDSDVPDDAQDLTNLLGSMIRIDVSTMPYSIPADNPFNTAQSRCDVIDAARVAQCPEIFAYGFRNPWRFSVDSANGDVWLGDVGDNTYEEIDRVTNGANYGWPMYEADLCISGTCDSTGLTMPIAQYGRSVGVAVTGGYVYRGSQSPALSGHYIFGDAIGGQYFSLDSTSTTGTALSNPLTAASSYGMAQGNDGEVYLLAPNADTTGENIYRITHSGQYTVEMASQLSDTGCFNVDNKTSPSGVFEYDVNSLLWTDGAEKIRALAIPDDTLIDVLADGDYVFPTDTNTCGVAAAEGDLGVTGAQRIMPGTAASSVILLRLQSVDNGDRMPPVGRLTEDTQAADVITQWIEGLGSCG